MEKKTRRKIRTLALLALGIGLFLGALHWSTHSQQGLRATWARLLRFVPGKISWEELHLDFSARTLEIKNLQYHNLTGQKIVDLGYAFGRLRWSSILRARAILKELRVQNLTIDVSGLPPSKEKRNLSPILQSLSRRLAIEQSLFENVRVILKNGALSMPIGSFVYHPSLVGKNIMQFEFQNAEGKIAEFPFSLQKIQYDGDFSVPDVIKEVFLFREATGKLELSGIQAGQWKVSDISTQANFNGNIIDFKGITISLGRAKYLLQMKLAPFDQHMEGKFSTDGFIEWEDMPGFKERVARIFDKLSLAVDFDLTGFVFKEMEGKLSASVKAQGNLVNPKVPSATLTMASTIKQGRFDLGSFGIQTERTKLSAKGFVDLNLMKLNTSVTGTDLDLHTLIAFFSDLELMGYVDFDGTIQGDLKQPDFKFRAKAKETGYKFMRFAGNEGEFDILNGDLHYRGRPTGDAGYSGSVEISAQEIFKPSRRTSLKTSFDQIEVAKLLETPQMTGKITGTYEMQVGNEQIGGKMNARVKDFHFYYFNLGDVEAEGLVAKDLFRLPKVAFHPPKFGKLEVPGEIAMHFSPAGFTFKGPLLAGMQVDGNVNYSAPKIVNAKVDCRHCAIGPLLAALDYEPREGSFDAKASFVMNIANFDTSVIQAEFTRFDFPMGETVLSHENPLKVGFRSGAFQFDDVRLKFNDRSLRLQGSFDADGPLNAQVNGELDLSLLKNFKEYFREGAGFAKVSLRAAGTLKDPNVLGNIEFENASVAPRMLGNTVEDLKGKIVLEPDKILFEDFQGSVLEGDLKLSGYVNHDNFQKITRADLRIDAREIAYTDPGTLKMYLSGKLVLSGAESKLRLNGNIDITEGRYIKNFDLSNFILKPASVPQLEGKGSGFDDLELDLRIKSPGELMVKNNVAEIYLKSDLRVTGTKAHPLFEGALSVLDGRFNFFKVNFESAKGFIDFRNPAKPTPYVDITATKTFDQTTENVVVSAKIEGYPDNLNLSFESNPPLEKREILSLMFTGYLPDAQQGLSGANVASSVLASQVTSLLEKPLNSLTHLDIFKLEASDPDSKSLSSLVVGKQITDRFSIGFKTDLDVQDTITNIQAEYLLLDNLLIKTSRSSTGRYRLDLTFRFKGY